MGLYTPISCEIKTVSLKMSWHFRCVCSGHIINCILSTSSENLEKLLESNLQAKRMNEHPVKVCCLSYTMFGQKEEMTNVVHV